MWTALVVTCPAHTWVAPLERELARMLALGPPDHRADTVLLISISIYLEYLLCRCWWCRTRVPGSAAAAPRSTRC